MLLLSLLLSPAFAADTWVGGAVATTPGIQGGAFTMPGQAEVDGRFGTDLLFGRLDLDLHFEPTAGKNALVTPILPEWAMLQVGQETWLVRGGITNPNMNLEDWDEWNNYLPTFSQFFNGATPGRVLGGEVARRLEDGSEIYLFGGADFDFAPPELFTPVVGAGFFTEQDAWSTWSGIALYPTQDYYGIFPAVEFYPLDALWVAVDGGAGLSSGSVFAGGQLVLNLFPEAVVNPVARGEYSFDPDNQLGVADATASLGLRASPVDFLRLSLEGKATFAGGEMTPGVFLMIAALRPEPGYYEVLPEEE